MANYNDAQKIKFAELEEKRFRMLFNKWAASVEGYNCNNLGDKIKIIEVWDSPLYRGILKTQYDQRLLEDTYERINRREPKGQYCEEGEINRWDLVDFPTSFTNSENRYRVTGTDHIARCYKCLGIGKVTCPQCNGSRTVAYEVTDSKTCSACNGGGWVTVGDSYKVTKSGYSNGTYYHKGDEIIKNERSTRCSVCGGTGYVQYKRTEMKPCDTCNATGLVTCSICGGDKLMVRYWKLRQILKIGNIVDYRFPAQISDKDARKMTELLNRETPWQVVENIHIDWEEYQKANLGSRPVVGDMLARLPERVAEKDNTTVCFHNLEVCECEAKTVIYEIDKKRYVCLLVGPEWKLFTVTSPISDKIDSERDRVNFYCNMRLYGKAWSILQKINKFPQAGSKEAIMQEQLEERMAMVTKFGGNIGLTLCSILMGPVFYTLYDHLNFFAPWTNWLMEWGSLGSEYLMILSVIFVLFIGMFNKESSIPEFTYRVASPISRFLRGFLLGIGNTLFFSAITIIIAYIGVLQLFGIAIYYAFHILGFILVLIYFLVDSILSIF